MKNSDVRVYEFLGKSNPGWIKGHLLRIETSAGDLLYYSLWGIKKICRKEKD